MKQHKNRLNIPVLAVTGKKNSGKTTVIESLISLMKEKGLKVCTIKHHHHGDFEPDTPGKDSYRHFNAGAEGVVLAAPNKTAYFENVSGEIPSINELATLFPENTSVILLEGFHKSEFPRIEVNRKEISTELLNSGSDLLVAVVTDNNAIDFKQIYSFSDIPELVDYILNYLKVADPNSQ